MRSPAVLPSAPALTDACNGDRALCDRRLDEVAFAGAHNSMSAAEVEGWMFPNQELGSVSLLGHGIRALLFDVHYGTPIGERVKTDIKDEKASRATFEEAIGAEAVDAAMRIRDRLTGDPTGPRAAYLCHGFCELGAVPLVPMLEGVRDFLVQHPGEVLVFVIEDYVIPADIEAAFRDSGLERFVYRGAVTAPFPTLREMIDSDQRARRLRGEGHRGRALVPPRLRDDPGDPLQVPRRRRSSPAGRTVGGPEAPLFQINHWIETTPTPRPSNAAIVNQKEFLLARARQCQEERGMLPNIVAVDFAMTGDVVGVVAAAERAAVTRKGSHNDACPHRRLPHRRSPSSSGARPLPRRSRIRTRAGCRSSTGSPSRAGRPRRTRLPSPWPTGPSPATAPAPTSSTWAPEGTDFRDFELETEVLARKGANSGIYFHTAFQEDDWPGQGFEIQVNNSQGRHGDYLEMKKTGSLYGYRNLYKAMGPDDEWFTIRARVEGKRVRVWVDGTLVVDYREPDELPASWDESFRRLGRGTFAFQCHDPESKVSYRNVRVRPLSQATTSTRARRRWPTRRSCGCSSWARPTSPSSTSTPTSRAG